LFLPVSEFFLLFYTSGKTFATSGKDENALRLGKILKKTQKNT